MTQQLLVGTPRPKPFRVTSADRSVKKGIMADGLRDLLNKVRTVEEEGGMKEKEEGAWGRSTSKRKKKKKFLYLTFI